MSRNIKEIGKELLGKSLNSYHRKTGLTQLEENNKMQDGILDGILSQVDDAYIEKTEQSNVIHLEGSGDGVVVLDSIEGNTMVNLYDFKDRNDFHSINNKVIINGKNFKFIADGTYQNAMLNPLSTIKPNTTYTIIVNIIKNTLTNGRLVVTNPSVNANLPLANFDILPNMKGRLIGTVTTKSDLSNDTRAMVTFLDIESTQGEVEVNIVVLEGDWSNREVPSYFEGLQSSFEEKVNDEGKYEIEILMKGSNQFDYTKKPSSVSPNGGGYANYDDQLIYFDRTKDYWFEYETSTQKGVIVYFQCYDVNKKPIYINYNTSTPNKRIVNYSNTEVFHRDTVYVSLKFRDTSATTAEYLNTMITKCHFGIDTPNDRGIKKPKQNKIKLLLNEPLRAIDNIKDRLCIKDGKLVVERRCGEIVFDGSDDEIWDIILHNFVNHTKAITKNIPNLKGTDNYSLANSYCDKFIQLTESPNFTNDTQEYYAICINAIEISINNSKLSSPNVNGIKKWLQQNPTKITYELKNPVYEEVLNEYGEPILLEGYENGTLYIDSTIVPTTTVRYTPKMESFKTLKEVENNNIMLTNDVNDNIIPYMMDVDLMIMEKEMALPSQINIRKMEVLDMTSMQKRTQDMLERLIKGKTLTEQECKTRVAVYLNAGKITDEQAKELNLLIDEIYA